LIRRHTQPIEAVDQLFKITVRQKINFAHRGRTVEQQTERRRSTGRFKDRLLGKELGRLEEHRIPQTVRQDDPLRHRRQRHPLVERPNCGGVQIGARFDAVAASWMAAEKQVSHAVGVERGVEDGLVAIDEDAAAHSRGVGVEIARGTALHGGGGPPNDGRIRLTVAVMPTARATGSTTPSAGSRKSSPLPELDPAHNFRFPPPGKVSHISGATRFTFHPPFTSCSGRKSMGSFDLLIRLCWLGVLIHRVVLRRSRIQTNQLVQFPREHVSSN
jgi:hypothetical protein